MMAQPRPFARNRRFATCLLLGMSAVFVATLIPHDPSLPVLFLRAVAEAGMIGGLADWFAVEALFRHPLGLKIPHTALLPRNKARVAKQVGRFITTQFLAPNLVIEKLRGLNIAKLAVGWLQAPDNAQALAHRLGGFGKAGLSGLDLNPPPAILKTKLRAMVLHPQFDAFLRTQIVELMGSDLRHALTDHALTGIAGLIDRNRDGVEKLVQSRSRWWIASTADRTFSRVMVDQVVALMVEMRDPGSELRRDFDTLLNDFVADPKQAAQVTRTLQALALRIVDSAEFDAAIVVFLNALTNALAEDLAKPDGDTVKILQSALTQATAQIAQDPQSLAQLSEDLLQMGAHLLDRNTDHLAGFIAGTIDDWDETELVRLFEDQVGSDLQFIRINGTLLGGMIGGVLFCVADLLPHLLH